MTGLDNDRPIAACDVTEASDPCRWTVEGRTCATHGVVQYRCFVCNTPWHRGDHDAMRCMKSLGEGYSILRDALEVARSDARAIQRVGATAKQLEREADDALRAAEKT